MASLTDTPDIPGGAPEPSGDVPGASRERPRARPEAFSFVADPGPGFAPGAAREIPGEDPGYTIELPEVPEEKVRAFLRNATDGIHALVGVAENDWRATRADMDRIAPPATAILNRYDAGRAVAQKSDEAALIIGLGLYSWRSMLERKAALELAELDAREHPAPMPTAAPAAAAGQPSGWAADVPVADGYMTMADRQRAAQERTPDAQPRQDPTPDR